jgi:hypothetical protein
LSDNFILTFDNLAMLASKPLAKCHSMMEPKIVSRVVSSNESTERINMCQVNRPDISFEPPPGGPMAAANNWKITRMTADKITNYISQRNV